MTNPVSKLMAAPDRAAEVARELVRRRADLVSHERASLQDHLVGVHDILSRWSQPPHVRLAGLLHSAYSTENFAFRLFGKRDRPRVRELIGAPAERLVHAFCAYPRDELLRAAEGRVASENSVALAPRGGGDSGTVDRRELSELMVIHAANLADQTSRADGGPGVWLAQVRRYLLAAQRGVAVPEVLLEGGVSDEAELITAYGKALRGVSSEDSPADVLSHSPVGEPLVIVAMRALAVGDVPLAIATAERASTMLASWGVAWDKRLRQDRWAQLAEWTVRGARFSDRELQVASERARLALEQANDSPERIWAYLDSRHSFDDGETALQAAPHEARSAAEEGVALPPRFRRYIGALRENHERPIPEFYPGLRTMPWYDPREFSITADLEAHAREIRDEMLACDADSFQDEAEDIGRTGRWSVLFLFEMGRRNEEVLARCPVTAEILERHRTMRTRGGLAYFSSLDPRTRIAPHQGPSNQRLRCHLGLEVPAECGVRVGGVVRAWEEGRCLVFDDSFCHEVWNNGDRRRVVLILDLWHPDLSDDEVALLTGLQRYGAANARTTERAWARNDHAKKRARAMAADRPGPTHEPSKGRP